MTERITAPATASAPASNCPICGRGTLAAFRPFCSKRCADVDLGRWFSGQYRTPSLRIDTGEEDEDRPDTASHPLDQSGDVG